MTYVLDTIQHGLQFNHISPDSLEAFKELLKDLLGESSLSEFHSRSADLLQAIELKQKI